MRFIVAMVLMAACTPEAAPAPIAPASSAPPASAALVDTDGDGVPDDTDVCPTVYASTHDGCPKTKVSHGGGHHGDRDGDGILDDHDKCPDDPEDRDGFQDDDGCPDPDNDGDGILDVQDKCPNDPETYNGRQDDDGCPD